MRVVKSCHAIVLLAIPTLLMGLLLTGCATPKPKSDPFFDQWQAKAKTGRPYLPAQPKAVEPESPRRIAPSSSPGTAPPEAAATAIDLPKAPLSVRFIDEDLATSIRTLARIAHQNILISPSVQGKLNLQTQDTPWDTVFMGIINSYGLTLIKEDNLLHVMSMDDLKQEVERKALKLQEQQTTILVTRVVPIQFSDPEAIAKSVTQLLSKDKNGKPRGSALVDQHSRSLIIQETEAEMTKLLAMVHRLDKPTPQIQIEAHIVETTKDVARELGIRWGGITNPHGDASTLLLTGSGTATFDSTRTPEFLYTTPNVYNVDLAAAAIQGINPASIGLLINAGDGILAAQLSALQQDGKLNILSSPSIATLDNSEAIIESGQEIPYVSVVEGTPTVAYKDALLNLTVTPHVITEGAIKLNILATKNEVDTANTVLGNPFINKKKAQTQLIVENNATVVLAGLSKETHSGANTGVPGLKEVPGLGWLFKKDSTNQEFEELLIFITPTILTKPAVETKQGVKP